MVDGAGPAGQPGVVQIYPGAVQIDVVEGSRNGEPERVLEV